MKQVVKNMNTLKAMERKGFIKLHNQTGSKITGLYGGRSFTCYYIDEGRYSFEYKGRKYGVEFFSGCFCPYVVKYSN